ncbi:Mitochondrial dicarboxylate transporter [Linderina macrospora]|uniref:Mitochondrial dicarboxylate transporter n=1 Tax=Linderina macrospora TaxID=4868 RepID=A0ACC1J9S3_9FUNG|nr:Mitochondrial dicarboxylate transporter [Linderina macrospora]
MTASCFTHPLDLIKVHLQTSTSRKSALHALRTVLTDRGLLGLYNGLSAALLRQGTYTMTRFAVYDLAKEQLSSNGKKSLGPWQVVVATVLSGVAGGIVGNPGEIVNVRMQNDQALPTKLQRNYKSAVHGLVDMVKTEGIGALMIGVGPSLVRATLATGSQFVSYDIVKAKMMAEGCEDSVGVHFAASFLAGIVATTVCSPADVVKSRMMALVRTEGAKIPGLWQTCRSIYANEGARAFFKGWVPSYVRLCPQLVITFVIYEKLRKSYFAHYKS